MQQEQGNLAIDSENIFPIIKKWMYSDHDIFIREVISNGCDAITKSIGKSGEFVIVIITEDAPPRITKVRFDI